MTESEYYESRLAMETAYIQERQALDAEVRQMHQEAHTMREEEHARVIAHYSRSAMKDMPHKVRASLAGQFMFATSKEQDVRSQVRQAFALADEYLAVMREEEDPKIQVVRNLDAAKELLIGMQQFELAAKVREFAAMLEAK